MVNFEKIKQTRLYRVINALASSAMLGLFLALAFFVYEVYLEKGQEGKNQEHFEKTVNQLEQISKSLSTRCLGSFPGYISEINEIFSRLQQEDTVVIFEDVLYYGIKSDPIGFSRLQHLLLNHSRQGGKVIVAYYDNHCQKANFPWQTVFHRMILEGRINPQYLFNIQAERHQQMTEIVFNQQQKNAIDSVGLAKERAIYIDSCVTEKYFRIVYDKDKETLQKDVEGYLNFRDSLLHNEIYTKEIDKVVENLCDKLDSIISRYLGKGRKNIENIHFADYENMYSEITDCIANVYRDHGIELVPLNEYLTMSCWLIKPANETQSTEAILAFPSKYSSEEIGFYSQDNLFSDYIMTILQGVRNKIDYKQ